MEERCSALGLRDVGLHRARIPRIEADPTHLGFPPADDALLRVHLECTEDAQNVGWRAPAYFMFMVMTSPKLSFDVDFENKPDDKPMVIVPFSSRQEEWSKLEGIDIHNKNRRGKYRRYKLDDPGFHPLTYGHMIEEYIRHAEAKSLGPDGTPCTAETRGLLQRAHITAGRIRYIDIETSSTWAQGDDLSVVTDNDEAGFRVVEYGKSRKVVLPDSLKREIKGTKLQRELRRRRIGQHTIENALHAHVRVNTYRKIVSAVEEYKKEKEKHV